MKSICLIICLLFFLGCTSTGVGTDPGLPPGYKLMCSVEGKYALFIPYESGNGGSISVTIWETAIGAKEFAWIFETWRKNPLPKRLDIEWHECE